MPQIMLLLTCTCVIVIAFVVRAAQGQEEPVRFLSGPSDPVEVCEDIHWKVLGGGPLLLYKNNTQVDVSLYNWQFDSLQGIYNVSWLSPVLVNSSIRLCYALISSYCSEAVDVIDCDSSGELITPPTVNIATQASIGTDLPPPAQPSSETHTPAPSASPSAASPSAASPSAASPPVTSTTGNNTTDTSTSDNKIAYIIIGTAVAGLVAIGVGVAVLFGCFKYWKERAKKKKTNGGEDIDMHKIEDRSKTPRMTVVPPGVTPVMTPEEEEEEEAFVPPGVTPGMTPEEKEEEEEEEAFVPPGMVDTSHSGSVETLTRLEASFQSSVRETKPTLESSSLPIHGMELSIHREALKKDHEEEDPEQEPDDEITPTQPVDAGNGPAQYLTAGGKTFEVPTSKKTDLYFIESRAQTEVRVESTRELAVHGQHRSTVLRQRAIRTLQSDRGTDASHDEEDEVQEPLSSNYPFPSPSGPQVPPSDHDGGERAESEDETCQHTCITMEVTSVPPACN